MHRQLSLVPNASLDRYGRLRARSVVGRQSHNTRIRTKAIQRDSNLMSNEETVPALKIHYMLTSRVKNRKYTSSL